MSDGLERFSAKIGYQFQQKALLTQALSHRSASISNNERLEFLGDSILNFIISEALYQKFPQAQEGTLTRLRASLVRGDTLVKLAHQFDLGQVLILGIGESKSGGHHRHSILENAWEALIGAIYLDSDLATCRKVVLTWFTNYLEQVTVSDNYRDPKTRLQEYLQAEAQPLPLYSLIKTEGPQHERIFYVRCQAESLSVFTEAFGASRKQAEQRAAEALLQQLALSAKTQKEVS